MFKQLRLWWLLHVLKAGLGCWAARGTTDVTCTKTQKLFVFLPITPVLTFAVNLHDNFSCSAV